MPPPNNRINKDWSYAVTVRPPATFPPPNTYNQKAEEIYRIMRRPEVSPNGLGSAIQMTQFFINRAGKNLPERQKKQIKKAVEMLRLEYAFLKQYDACGLENEPDPVHPMPPPHERVGGRYG